MGIKIPRNLPVGCEEFYFWLMITGSIISSQPTGMLRGRFNPFNADNMPKYDSKLQKQEMT